MTASRSRPLFAALAGAVLLLASCAGAASPLPWETVTVDAAGQVGLFTSLALDGVGAPRISYYDDTNGDLKYAWRDGAGWHAETVDADGRVGMWTSLAIDAAGEPRISYYDDTSDDLKYAWRDDVGWHAETVDTSGWVGEYTSLALDAAGRPRISYYDRTNDDLKYAWRDGSGWRTETVDSLRIVGWYTSLALDTAGNPRISYLYENTDDLRYAWLNESGWQIETVDTEGYVGKCSSLVLDAAGDPRISYFDDTFENKDDLKYAWRDCDGWHVETVDTEGLVGWYTSLALDPAGEPRISYFDDTNDDLKYAWRDCDGWHAGTVDADGTVGEFTALALDAAGNPLISYYDRTNGDLKFAGIAPPPPAPGGEDTVPGGAARPADTDGDGIYEDVNGNGRLDFADVVLYFNNMAWIGANEPVPAFDYNANGRIDFADVVRLFDSLGAPATTPITASFTVDRANGTAPLEVRFTSTSTGPFDDLAWTVTSGHAPVATMNGTAPTFTFLAPGAYAVALTARNTSTNASATVTQTVTVTVPGGPDLPYPGPHVLPGRVEAEDYDVGGYADTTTINEGGAYRFDGADIEVLSGNYNVGWIRTGEYLNYSVDAAAAGDFALTLNVANTQPKNEPVRIYLDGAPAGEVWIGLSSNGWTFREFSASAPITVPAGRHVVTVAFEQVERINLDWLSLAAITPTPAGTAAPYPSGHVLPARIEAEYFDAGGEGVAYHDAEPANLGLNRDLRPGEGVDIETAGGVTNICFVRAGEWLNYSIDMVAAGNVTLSLSAANPDAGTKTVAVSLDGVPAGAVPVGPTGGWTAYREFFARAPITVPAGRHVVTLVFAGAERLNLDWLDLAAEVPTPTVTVTPNGTPATPVSSAPYPSARLLPAVVEAEDFDAGGEGVAYHDTDSWNPGNSTYRAGEGVDLETEGGVTNVCFVRAGEWLNYSVDATVPVDVVLSLRAANPDAAAKAVRISLDGIPAGEVMIASTGGWTRYADFAAPAPLAIPAGRHVVTVAFEEVTRINLDRLDISAASPAPAETEVPAPNVTAVPGQEYTLAVAGLDLVGEWALVLNTGTAWVDLRWCTLSNQGSTRVYTFPAVALGPGATVTVHSGGGADTGTDLYWGLGSEAWDDAGDTATLRRPDGNLIAALARQAQP